MQRLDRIADPGVAVADWSGPIDSPAVTTQRVPAPPSKRDQRLDMFRGLALVMIFINHVPGTVYENITNRNFGFSDAAEAFVFMSGLAAGLAYSSKLRSGSLWAGISRVWGRARQLYFVHLTITLVTLAIFAAAALWFDRAEILAMNNVRALFRVPLEAMIGIPAMTHQLGYLNILPLYITLLLFTPLFLWIGIRRPLLLLGASVLLWASAGQFNLNFPNFPNPGGWFFNPFSWQLIFVIGLLCGAVMKQGGQFVPYNRTLFWVAAGFVILVKFWVKFEAVSAVGLAVLSWLSKNGVPGYITWFDKTFLALPRLLHALALFYVMASLGIVRRFADSDWSTPLKLMGRNGLAIFATGTVLSMFLQVFKLPIPPDPVFDGVLLGTGLALQVGLAWVLTKTTELKSLRTAS